MTFITTILLILSTQLVLAQDASTILQRAKFLVSSDDHLQAETLLRESIVKFPENSEIYFMLGKISTLKGDIKEAISSFEKSIEYDPKNTDKYEALASIHYNALNFEEAIKNYEVAAQVAVQPGLQLYFYLNIINVYFETNKGVLAKKYLDKAKEITPDNFDLQFYKAMYLNEIGDYQEANALLSKMIENIPPIHGNEKYYFELGRSQFYTGKYQEASKSFKIADKGHYKIKVRHFKPSFLISIANALYDIFEYEQSEEYLKHALQLDPANGQGIELKTKLESVKVDKRKVISTLRTSVENDESASIPVDKYSQLANLLFQAGEYQEALLTLDKLLQEKPKSIAFLLLKAICEKKINMDTDSDVILSKLLKDPYTKGEIKARVAIVLGMIYRKNGMYKEAIKSFKSGYYKNYKNLARVQIHETNEEMLLSKTEE